MSTWQESLKLNSVSNPIQQTLPIVVKAMYDIVRDNFSTQTEMSFLSTATRGSAIAEGPRVSCTLLNAVVTCTEYGCTVLKYSPLQSTVTLKPG